MEEPEPGKEKEFNTPMQMLERVVFLLCLGGFTAGILMALAGLVMARPVLLLGGLGAFGAAVAARDWLTRRGRFQAIADAFDRWPTGPVPLGPETSQRVTQLAALLSDWEKMEQKRGSSEFDVWAVQSMRNEIHAIVDTDPALADLFRPQRRAA